MSDPPDVPQVGGGGQRPTRPMSVARAQASPITAHPQLTHGPGPGATATPAGGQAAPGGARFCVGLCCGDVGE